MAARESQDMELIGPGALEELERAVEQAFATGAHEHLQVLGYGEISSVIAWPGARGPVACKRLPVFSERARLLAYCACLDDYLTRMDEAGIAVVDTRLYALDKAGGSVIAYCVQPVLAAESLGPRVFAAGDEACVLGFFDAVLEHVLGAVTPALGLDAQLSNWALAPGGTSEHTRLVYLDVSTPLMRDADGRDRLDQDLFLSSLPRALRALVKRFMLRDILARYYHHRHIIVDFLANLHKERLVRWLPALIARANERGAEAFGEGGPITEREVARYYRADARTWGLLQRLRRADRAWQRTVRRRPYPFLLPGRIER